jgi:ketosteroid isomerase-like protein
MSEEHVETLRAIYHEWAKGNVKAGVELLDPHIVYVNRPGLVEAATCYGLEAMQRWMRDFLAAWDTYSAHATEFIEAGDSVLVAVRQEAVGSGSGVPVETEIFHVWTFRSAQVIRLESIADRDEALEAAGLSE